MLDQRRERLDEPDPRERRQVPWVHGLDPLPPPLGLLIGLASYRFEPPQGATHTDVLFEAHRLGVGRGDANIEPIHLADAIELLVGRSQCSLSEECSPRNP